LAGIWNIVIMILTIDYYDIHWPKFPLARFELKD